MKSEDTRNLFLAIALSVLVMTGWQYFYAGPLQKREHQAQMQAAEAKKAADAAAAHNGGETGAAGAPSAGAGITAPGGATTGPVPAPATLESALAATPRVAIDTPSLAGSINLRGGVLDDLVLKDYRETIAKDSPLIRLFSPAGPPNAYLTETGFVGAAGTVNAPRRDTLWTADSTKLTQAQPVTLTWSNGAGLTFRRVIAVDDRYMFTIKDSVANSGGETVTLRPYALILRHGRPSVGGYAVLHEGFIGVVGDGGVNEVTYAQIDKDAAKAQAFQGVGGWLGFTDKYWASTVIPDQSAPIEARFTVSGAEQPADYQADFVGAPKTLAPGETAEAQTRVFAGAKVVSVIDAYETQYGIKKFYLMIDWGWFWMITIPMFRVLDLIYKVVGNFGVAILIVTVLVKALFFPLANRSYQSMAKMKKVQPQIAALKEMYPDDKVKQQQEQMALFKREGVNPISGCLPMMIQIPVFFALYKVIFTTIEMRHAPFFGWIKDLSAPDPTNVFTLFGLIPWNPAVVPIFGHFMMIGIWPLIMGVSMFFQMKMNPEPADPVQKSMFAWMPVIFTFMLGTFPAGLVIYWTWNNLLTVAQQYYIMRKSGVKVELWDNLLKLFRKSDPAPATAAAPSAAAPKPAGKAAKTPPAKSST